VWCNHTDHNINNNNNNNNNYYCIQDVYICVCRLSYYPGWRKCLDFCKVLDKVRHQQNGKKEDQM
ncbi:MAG: hypothetical protein ACEY3H_00275, partial [Wolbachia sp.]